MPLPAQQELQIPYGAWRGTEVRELRFPAGWKVHVARAQDGPEIGDEAILQALENPVGTPPLHILAQGKRSAVIAVDDITRPTPAHRILPILIQELQRGGIQRKDVKILIARGSHRPMTGEELRKKLGDAIVEEFTVLQHEFMGPDLTFLGWIDGGPVYINREFLEADLRICIGSVIPHGEMGFGGGAKMVVPGLAGELTIAHFHGSLPKRLRGRIAAKGDRFDRRVWAETVARHVGVHAVICTVVNMRRQITGIYAGDLRETWIVAARHALQVGSTRLHPDFAHGVDVLIINAYPLDTDPLQLSKSLWQGVKKLPHNYLVAVNPASDGIFYHGVGWGTGVGKKRILRNCSRLISSPVRLATWLRGTRAAVTHSRFKTFCLYTLSTLSYGDFLLECHPEPEAVSDEERKFIVFSENFPAWGFSRVYPKAVLCKEWESVISRLENVVPPDARVLVIPCSPLQFFEAS